MVLLFSFQLFATNYYVRPVTGEYGTEDGSDWDNAFDGFGDIAWGSINPGDTIFVSGGVDSAYYNEQLVIGDVQGAASAYITIIAGKYATDNTGHSGRVIIDGGGYIEGYVGGIKDPILIGGSTGYVTSYIHVKGFEIRGGKSGVWIVERANCIIIDSMYIHHFSNLAGVLAEGYRHYIDFTGIDSLTISNCRIISDVHYPDMTLYGTNWQTDGIFVKGATSTVIHDNYIHTQSIDSVAHVDGIQSQESEGFVIYRNVVIADSSGNPPEGGGMALILRSGDMSGDSLPVIIYNNFFYQGGIWYVSDPQAYGFAFNTHRGDQANYLVPSSPTYIFHNTITGLCTRNAGVSLEYFGASNDGVFINNIVAVYEGNSGLARWTFGVNDGYIDSIRNNLVWNNYNDNSDMYTANDFLDSDLSSLSHAQWLSEGGTGISENPDFVHSFGYEPDQGALDGELQSSSPAINAGEDITYLKNYIQTTFGITVDIEHDINGNLRDTSQPTIGAYEYEPFGGVPIIKVLPGN